MISYLDIALLTQSMQICLRWLRKQSQTCQPQSGSYITLATDHLLPPTHRVYRAAWASRLRALTLAVTLGVSFLFANGAAWANGCSGDTVISTNVTTTQANSTQLCSFTVNNGNSISTSGMDAINNSGTITTLDNNGSILTTAGNFYGIYNFNTGTITTLNNTGTISGDYGIRNSGTITTLNNTGTISGSSDSIINFGTINTLNNTNTGTISAPSEYGIFNISTIGTLNNAGTISGDYGIRNSGTITTLNNTGTISGGIYNTLTITTLNNQQGKLGSNPVRLARLLPTNYNIIIASSANYGQLAGSLLGSGTTTTFGVSSLSTTSSSILNTTLTSVLSGIPSAALTNKSGTSNGYTFVLTETVTGSGIWNLLITAYSAGGSGSTSDSSSGGTSISNISSGTSVGLSSLGANPVLSGGTLVLLSGDSSSTAFSVTSASTIQNPTSGSATLSGVFSGAGGLTFIGTGSTIMSGANTYSGGTTVAGGTLAVAGPSPTGTGDVFVSSAGTLMGTGTIAGNSIVNGVLKPGNSPGYLSFTQNLTLNTGSTYQQDIAGNVQANSATPVGASGYYSFVNVGNQLVINSGATLTPRLSNLFSSNESGYGSAIYVPALGDRFRMITATGGISGRFDTLTQPAELTSGTQFIAFYNVNGSNSLDLAVTPTSYSTTLSSSTTNAREVANVLDQLLGVNKTGTATAAQDSLLYAVAGQTAASLPSFAQSLSGEVHAASAATLPQATQRVQQAVLARLGDFHMPTTQLNSAGSNPLASGAITGNNPSGLPTANISSNPAVNPNAANITSAAITDGRAWGEIAYQRGVRSGNSGGNGYNNNLYQAVFGVDAYTNAALGLKLGGGLALSNTTVNATGGNSTIQQGALFLYGKMPVAQDYVLDGMVSIGLSSSKLSRSDVTGISNGFSNKSVMGNDVLVSAGLSRPFETSDVRITPYVRLTYQYVGQAAYDEGASAAALNVGRMSANGVRAVIGVGAGSLNKDPLKAGYTYRANLAIGADSQGLLNPTLNTTLGGFSSSVTTPTAGSTFVQAGLYGTVKVADSAYAYAGVSVEARTGQTLYGGSVGLRVAF
jgi:uncharacterized protein with beta-barrel porin domain